MKIIVNQDKELRAVGYDEKEGCKPLDAIFYISKSLNPIAPVHCIVDNKYHFLMNQINQNNNYYIYRLIDLFDVAYEQGNKTIKLSFNLEETKEITLYFPSFERKSLSAFVERGV